MKQTYDDNQHDGQFKNYILSVVGLIIIFTIANGGATQYVAQMFSYSDGLGSPLFGHIYQPFAWVKWSWAYQNYYPEQFKRLYMVLIFVFFCVFTIFMIFRFIGMRRLKTHEGVHGTAHWATTEEVKNTGLIRTNGVFVGAWKDKKNNTVYLRHNGPEHVLAYAPTRSGKGVSLVLPTLLTWAESALILDIKGENWALTAGWRQRYANNKVLRFDPSSETGSVKFNPLEEIRLGTLREVGDVQTLSYMLVDTDGKGLDGDFWRQSTFAFLTGLILHVLYKAKNEGKPFPNLSSLYNTINDPSVTPEALFTEMTAYKHINGKPHQIVAMAGGDMKKKAHGELSGILGTANTCLNLYVDPLLINNISKSDFKIRELMNFEQPVSLYLVMRPSDKDRLKPLFRLVLNQILRLLIEDLKFENGESVKQYKHRLLLLMDELSILGKMEVLQEELAYMAGYGMLFYGIFQDIAQLYSAYTKEEAITSNAHIRIAFAPNKPDTAKELSSMTGTATVTKTTATASGGRISPILTHINQSFQEISRPLLTPDECMRLPGAKKDGNGKIIEAGDMLIFVAGHAPIYGVQPLYFQDPVLADRARVPAPERTDIITQSERNQGSATEEEEKTYAFNHHVKL